MSGNNHTTLL